MRRLDQLEIEMLLSQMVAVCPVCGQGDTLMAKPLPREGSYCGFCQDCLDECEAVGIGETDTAAIQDFIEKNLP